MRSERTSEDLEVIEGERDRTMLPQQTLDREEACLGGVVTAADCRLIAE